jgi:hypothetical protein
MLVVDFFKTSVLLGLCSIGFASSALNLTTAYLVTFTLGCAVVMLAIHHQLASEKTEAWR